MTIMALSSGVGYSGVAVIRISGLNTKKILLRLTSGKLPVPRKATLLKINNINTSEMIDEGIILWFPAPKSYTGEDMAELHVHGSPAVVKNLQETILSSKKCRLAEPGEFTKLAFINGKINLMKAEAIGDLIASETEIQRKQATEIFKGSVNKKFNLIREKLIKNLSLIEANIDFPDEGLPNNILLSVKKDILKVKKVLQDVLDDGRIGERIREGFKIVITGPPNTGKSSLINFLSRRQVSIISSVPGTTRDIMQSNLDFDGYPISLFDTAGIRKSKNTIERKGIKLALKKLEMADIVIVVIDHKNLNFPYVFNDFMSKNPIIAINKSDIKSVEIKSKLKKFKPIKMSIKKNINLDKLIKRIKNILKKKLLSNPSTLITRERHRSDLNSCLLNINNFLNSDLENDFEKSAEDLRLAIRDLGKIIGKVDVEEILSSIFNEFCIGK